VVKTLRYKPTGRGFDSRWCHCRSHYDPGVDSASNRNEHQVYFLGVKAAVLRLTILPPSCAVVKKSGNLNFLEPSGQLQACNGTALPLLRANERNLSIQYSTFLRILRFF
jgi:hypothetical protein